MKYTILALLILLMGCCATTLINMAAYNQGWSDGQEYLQFEVEKQMKENNDTALFAALEYNLGQMMDYIENLLLQLRWVINDEGGERF